MILVLAGPVHSGKTTFLRRLLPDLEALRLPVSGYLSLLVMNKGETAGYDLFDIKKGKSIPFLRTEGEAGWQKVGPYFFLPCGLEAAAAAILGYKPGEILIVDEVGPMELSGRGVWPALSEVLSRPLFDCLLVVRKPLLDDLQDRLGKTPVKVFDVEHPDVCSALLQALKELRAVRNERRDKSDLATPRKGRSGR
jgi:nucleoside-triphosphatase THEP1